MKQKALLVIAGLAVLTTGCISSKPRTEPPAPVYERGSRTSGGDEYFEEGTSGIDSPEVMTGSGEYQAGDLAVAQATAPTSAPIAETAAPTETATSAMPAYSTSSPQQVAMAPATTTASASMGSAASSLMAKAEQQQRSGDLTGAASTLERALRIEPRNALLWNRLANVRLEQRRNALASELASKSNAFAGSDNALKKNNWLIISSARQASGDAAGAESARRRANELR